MANDEYVALLKKSVDAWNTWRRDFVSGAPWEPCKRTAMCHEPTRAKLPPFDAPGGISMDHQCCAVATAAA